MFIIYILALVILLAYALLLFNLIRGWLLIKEFKEGFASPNAAFISVIIASRNEEENILNCLSSVSKQTLDINTFEVLVIDDFSSDNTNNIIKRFCTKHINFHQFSFNEHKGKKEAIDFAIKRAKGELIVCTDADCEHKTEWLKTIKKFYLSSNAKMIVAPVLVKSTNWFECMQSLDFLSLMASGAAATGIKKPIMNNAANLAFTKEAYLNLNDPTNKKLCSGDDIFLLLKLKKKYSNKILFLKSKKAVVYTNPKRNFAAFISQRKRWASKSKHYRDFDIIYTATTVLLVQMFLLISLVLTIISLNSFFVFLFTLILKSAFDLIFLYITTRFFYQKLLLWYFLPMQLANVFLIPFLAFSGLFSKTKWKS